MKIRKTIALILSVLMVLSCAGLSVFAEDKTEVQMLELADYSAPEGTPGIYVTFDESTHTAAFDGDVELPESGEVTVNDVLNGDVWAGDYFAVWAGDELVGTYDGDALAGQTLYIPGSSYSVDLITNGAADYGFGVKNIIPLPIFGNIFVTYHSGLDDDSSYVGYYRAFEGNVELEDSFDLDPEKYDRLALAGWATEEGGKAVYAPGASIPEEEADGLELWAVWTKVALGADEIFSFNNYKGYFVNDERGEKYYMSKEDYRLLQLNIYKLYLGAAIIPAIGYSIAAAVDVNKEWGGSCYGMIVVTALQHMGKIDMLSMQGVSSVSELEPDDELISFINYYHVQQESSWIIENKGHKSMPSMYRTQLKAVCDALRAGKMVQFGYYPESTLNFKTISGHSVLLVGIYDDPDGNHVCIAYDANKPWCYEPGNYRSRYIISPDYSEVMNTYDDEIVDIKWHADFEQFEPFDRSGRGDVSVWYERLLTHIFETFNRLFEALRMVFGVK
ncbi:MAG: hypothetical protein IJK23_14005 [Clostridia bacterium]|nr:hypothetical protein [Clostridia bacterium]